MKKLMIVLAALSFTVASLAQSPYLVLSMKDSTLRVYSLTSNPKMYNYDGSHIFIVEGENLYDVFKFVDVKEYTLNNYMLSYVLDGDTISSDIITSGTPLIAKESPTREGYTFSGWSEIPATMPANDVVITGYFTPNNTTAIDNVSATETSVVQKYLEDGTVYILRNGERFTVDGRRIE